ncbi:MAG: hypothetical protein AAFV53_02590 [Myxococcota bacterium]
MRLNLIWLPTMLAGCFSELRSIDGDWAGACTIDNAEFIEIPFALALEEFDDGWLEGGGSFTYKEINYEGPVYGDRIFDEIEIVLDGANEGQATRMEIEGELESDVIVGECAFFGVEGELVMGR